MDKNAMTPVWRIGIFRPKSLVGGIFVHHRIHSPRRDAEEQPRTTEFAKIPIVTMPIWLRNDGNTQPLGFQYPSDDSHAKRRMVNVSISREDDYIETVPPEPFKFFLCCRKPIHSKFIVLIYSRNVRKAQ